MGLLDKVERKNGDPKKGGLLSRAEDMRRSKRKPEPPDSSRPDDQPKKKE